MRRIPVNRRAAGDVTRERLWFAEHGIEREQPAEGMAEYRLAMPVNVELALDLRFQLLLDELQKLSRSPCSGTESPSSLFLNFAFG